MKCEGCENGAVKTHSVNATEPGEGAKTETLPTHEKKRTVAAAVIRK
jgi:hypothetical protein